MPNKLPTSKMFGRDVIVIKLPTYGTSDIRRHFILAGILGMNNNQKI